MSRPAMFRPAIDAAPAPAQPRLEAVCRLLGPVPNLFRRAADSLAAQPLAA